MIYLDNNASTCTDPAVVEAMLSYFQQHYANPSSLHLFGQRLYRRISEVRDLIAQKLGCMQNEIVFTSSGTEANNLCIKGFAYAHRNKGNHIITSKIEHASVLAVLAYLETQGFVVSYLDVDHEGFVCPEQLKQQIRKQTILISIGHVNSEIGTIQPLEQLLEAAGGIPFHTDVVQSFLKTDFNVSKYPVALASFSGHKFHAPKGIGFIYKNRNIAIEALIHGGTQEFGVRSGTENVPYIIAIGEAIQNYRSEFVNEMKILQAYLLDCLETRFGMRINGPKDLSRRVCNNINISCDCMEGETLLGLLSEAHIYISTGSACSSKQKRISHVLNAIGCPPAFIHGNMRIGLSKYTKKEEIEQLLATLSTLLSNQSLFSLTVC